jgi:RHS repeat-associated protein
MDTPIIDSWVNGAYERTSTPIYLTAGTWYRIKLQYFDNTGEAHIYLRWWSAQQKKDFISPNNLKPCTLGGEGCPPIPTPTATQTFTRTLSPTKTPTLPATATSTRTPTATSTATATGTNTPTATPSTPSGQVWKYYYYAGSQRVAVRVSGSGNPQENGLFYTLGDHLGSTSLTTDAGGAKVGEMRYMPWGETRYQGGNTPTDYHYTGQREEAGIGLYYYGARWYDQTQGRWIIPDTIMPDSSMGTQAWDKYAYVNNNPLRNIDPSGHWGFSFNLSDAFNAVLAFTTGWKTSDVANALDTISTVLDVAALVIDSGIAMGEGIAATTAVTGPVNAGVAIGAFETNPATRSASFVGNILSSASTTLTAVSDLITGDSNFETSVVVDENGIDLNQEYSIGTDTYISYLSTTAGWVLPIGIFAAPNAAVPLLNDLGYFDGSIPDSVTFLRIGDEINKKKEKK